MAGWTTYWISVRADKLLVARVSTATLPAQRSKLLVPLHWFKIAKCVAKRSLTFYVHLISINNSEHFQGTSKIPFN
jgi:hypothetical protein